MFNRLLSLYLNYKLLNDEQTLSTYYCACI